MPGWEQNDSVMETNFSIAPHDIMNQTMQTDRRTMSQTKPQSSPSQDPLLMKHKNWFPISREYERRIQRMEGKLRSVAQDAGLFKIENARFKNEADQFRQYTKTNRQASDPRNITTDCFSCADRRLTNLLRKPFMPTQYDIAPDKLLPTHMQKPL